GGGDGEVGDEGVAGLAAAVGDDGAVAAVLGQADGPEGLGEGADLVDLDEDAVGDPAVDAALETLGVGDEQVVADELKLAAEPLGVEAPAGPVVLGHAVLDRDQRILAGE